MLKDDSAVNPIDRIESVSDEIKLYWGSLTSIDWSDGDVILRILWLPNEDFGASKMLCQDIW